MTPNRRRQLSEVIDAVIEQSPSCEATVVHAGIEQPCFKPAAGLARPAPGDEDATPWPWPACAWHLNRWGAVPLLDILAAVRARPEGRS